MKRAGWLRGQTTRPAIIGVPTGARNAGMGAPTGDQSTNLHVTPIPPGPSQESARRSSNRRNLLNGVEPMHNVSVRVQAHPMEPASPFQQATKVCPWRLARVVYGHDPLGRRLFSCMC